MSGVSSCSYSAIYPNADVPLPQKPNFSIVNGGTPPGQKFVVPCLSNVQIQFAGYIKNLVTEDPAEVVNIWLNIASASGDTAVSVPQSVRVDSGAAVVSITPVQVANLSAGTYYSEVRVNKNAANTDTATIEGELSILVTSLVL
jgi:hypothetical protein